VTRSFGQSAEDKVIRPRTAFLCVDLVPTCVLHQIAAIKRLRDKVIPVGITLKPLKLAEESIALEQFWETGRVATKALLGETFEMLKDCHATSRLTFWR